MDKTVANEPGQDKTGLALHIPPVPRISIQAFCESARVAEVIGAAGTDRRMDRAILKVEMGGAPAAVTTFRSAPTPNLIVLEFAADDPEVLLRALDDLAESCDAGTKVVVIGRVNDVKLYRELMRRGVSDYLISPIETLGFIRSVSELYAAPGTEPLGRVIAVTGTKGGVGASTIAHNLAWAIARGLSISTVIADTDIAFGTAGLNFNQDPPQGIAEAVFAPERLDQNFLDRLLSKCSETLSLLAAPATLDRVADFQESAFDQVIDLLRGSVPCTVLDVPHVWTGWSRRMLIAADEIVLVASPDLANLRNAKGMMDVLRQARPNDRHPRLLLNMAGVAKRPEISPADFAKAVDCEPSAVIPFEPQLFGTAANNGQMIAEIQANGRITGAFLDMARLLVGRTEQKKASRSLLAPLVSRLRSKG